MDIRGRQNASLDHLDEGQRGSLSKVLQGPSDSDDRDEHIADYKGIILEKSETAMDLMP